MSQPHNSLPNFIDKIENLPSQYFHAVGVCLIPFISLFLFAIGSGDSMIFWLVFLLSPIPCGVIGIVLSLKGLKKAKAEDDRFATIIGRLGILASALYSLAGVFAYFFIAIVLIGE